MPLSDEYSFDNLDIPSKIEILKDNIIRVLEDIISAKKDEIVAYKRVIENQSERIKELENNITKKDSAIDQIKRQESSSSLMLPDFKCLSCGSVVVNPKKICCSCGNDIREELKYWRLTKNHEKILKDNQEVLKILNITISKLEDENEQLKIRIEKGKKIWNDNKKLEEDNEKLKLILKKLGVNEPPIVRRFTDKDLPVHGQDASSNQSGNIPVPDSKNPMMAELSTPSKSNIDHTRSYAHTFRERGRFGSHPSHDDFGDESAP